jgi:hypothetical protein
MTGIYEARVRRVEGNDMALHTSLHSRIISRSHKDDTWKRILNQVIFGVIIVDGNLLMISVAVKASRRETSQPILERPISLASICAPPVVLWAATTTHSEMYLATLSKGTQTLTQCCCTIYGRTIAAQYDSGLRAILVVCCVEA